MVLGRKLSDGGLIQQAELAHAAQDADGVVPSLHLGTERHEVVGAIDGDAEHEHVAQGLRQHLIVRGAVRLVDGAHEQEHDIEQVHLTHAELVDYQEIVKRLEVLAERVG